MVDNRLHPCFVCFAREHPHPLAATHTPSTLFQLVSMPLPHAVQCRKCPATQPRTHLSFGACTVSSGKLNANMVVSTPNFAWKAAKAGMVAPPRR